MHSTQLGYLRPHEIELLSRVFDEVYDARAVASPPDAERLARALVDAYAHGVRNRADLVTLLEVEAAAA